MIQEYNKYTADDHKVWSVLFNRQMETLQDHSAREFIQGVKDVGFTASLIPDFDDINPLLASATGWQIFAVPGIMPNKEFFEALSEKRFPATTWIRTMAQLDYLEEPDMFHDVFGHVPLLSNANFCNFLHGLSEIALKHIDDEEVIELIGRVYWFTVEFGLIGKDDLKIYGAGLASSIGETKHSLDPAMANKHFNIETILGTEYRKDIYQDSYFVIDTLDELYASLPVLEDLLDIKEERA